MNIPYEKDNKERIPFTHYLEEFQALDPETASLRSGIPYDKDKKVFTLRMLGKEFLISSALNWCQKCQTNPLAGTIS